MQIGLFQFAIDKKNNFSWCFQNAKGYRCNETKMKYKIHQILEIC